MSSKEILSQKILELKLGKLTDSTKKQIQKLQQQLDNKISEDDEKTKK